uniref:Aspartokinase n=1 Tax=Kalanchoe fedtschenkoi TaxID=63787 RepID=A0A7N0TRB1_KALFE
MTHLSTPAAFSVLQRPQICRKSLLSGKGRHDTANGLVKASVTEILPQVSDETTQLPRGDTWSVHKFGGTCVGTPQRIKNVADIVLMDNSERKVVVVSAMSKVTDMMYDLIEKAQSRNEAYVTALEGVLEKHRSTALEILDGDELAGFLLRLHHDINNLKAMLRAIYIAGHATESFTDFVVGHGELWSAQMLSAVIRKNGTDCNWMDAREVLIVNPISSNQVDPDFQKSEKRLDKWFSQRPCKTIVATGFIASTPENIPTTLKRDGSDFSAAIMGALFRARQVTIWTDVDGVFSADPRKVSDAVILKTLSYQEAWEMSYFGANVLHPRTIIPVMQYDIPILIRNVFNLSAPGTLICRSTDDENDDGPSSSSLVKGFATIDNLALVNVEGTGMVGVPGTASTIFGAVKDVGANVIMISQASSEHSVCFAVPEKEVKAVADALASRFSQAIAAGRISKVDVIPNCSILAAVGQKMASTPGVSATLFNALAKANINIRAIAQGCSEYNITVVLKREDCIRALKAVHSRFYLSRTAIAMGIIGPGLIGATLLDQLRDQVHYVC